MIEFVKTGNILNVTIDDEQIPSYDLYSEIPKFTVLNTVVNFLFKRDERFLNNVPHEDVWIEGTQFSGTKEQLEIALGNEFTVSNSGVTSTLTAVLVEGHQTGENDIDAKNGNTWNGARLVVGPNRAGFGNGEYNNGGDKGVTQYCANGFALDFQNGELRHRQQGSNAPKPLPTISPIKYPGTVFDGLNNPSADDPILETTNIDFIGDFAADFETYFNYTSTFRVYCYDGSGILLAIGKYDGVNYVDPLTTLYLYDVTNIVEGATIDQIVKVVGYDFVDDTLITVKEANRKYISKDATPLKYMATIAFTTGNAPTITTESSDIGTPTTEYNADGDFDFVFPGKPFLNKKVFIIGNSANDDYSSPCSFYSQKQGNNDTIQMKLFRSDTGAQLGDGFATFKIEVI